MEEVDKPAWANLGLRWAGRVGHHRTHRLDRPGHVPYRRRAPTVV